mgnify:CR=1 FL=1
MVTGVNPIWGSQSYKRLLLILEPPKYLLKVTISLAVIDITWQIIISISEPSSLNVLIECSLCWFTSNHNLIYMRLSSDIIVKPITLTNVRLLYRLGFHSSGIYKPIFCYFYNFFPLINQSSSFSSYHIPHSPSTLSVKDVIILAWQG